MSSCECWIPAVTSAAALVLHALLLLALYIMLSRKIAQHSRGMQASSGPGEHRSSGEHRSPEPSAAPAPAPGGDKARQPQAQTPAPAPAYAGSSDTSSDTSEDLDSPSCSQGPGSEENINYTSLVFRGQGHEPGSAQDYENMKTGVDYVNVDPKKRKIHFWPFSSPKASKAVEYTEVKL